jgi:deoxyribodipyrimidine photolyase-like uncharacterized protein
MRKNLVGPLRESNQVLDYFCHHLLKHFGDYEDAMHTDESSISFLSLCDEQ